MSDSAAPAPKTLYRWQRGARDAWAGHGHRGIVEAVTSCSGDPHALHDGADQPRVAAGQADADDGKGEGQGDWLHHAAFLSKMPRRISVGKRRDFRGVIGIVSAYRCPVATGIAQREAVTAA